MFKINKKTNKISLTKGDNASFKVNIMEANGQIRQLFDDDVITLTVRKTANSDIAFTKTAEKGVINIVPADTKSLATGTYVYDIYIFFNCPIDCFNYTTNRSLFLLIQNSC